MAAKRKDGRGGGPCPVMDVCGGCECLGYPYKKQLARKHEAMRDLFGPYIERFGGPAEIDPVLGMGATSADAGKVASPRAFRYKAATPFAPGPDRSVRSGFFVRGTHRIAEVPDCPVEAPGARRILNGVAEVAERCGIAAYDEDSRRGLLRYAVLRLGWKSDEGILTVVTSNRDIPHADEFVAGLQALDPRITTVAQNVNGRATNAILGPETRVLAGAPRMRDELLGCTFEISPGAFYQTNPAQTEVLYRTAIEDMALEEGDVVLDAYCGSGTIGLTAAHAARERGVAVRLVGVERNPAGARDAVRCAHLNGLEEVSEFVAEDATAYVRRAAAASAHVDVLVLDPPRAGSTEAFLEAVLALRPRRVVYVSCNPATQVRDLEVLARGGYRLARLTPVDMFPHTSHVETVALLTSC